MNLSGQLYIPDLVYTIWLIMPSGTRIICGICSKQQHISWVVSVLCRSCLSFRNRRRGSKWSTSWSIDPDLSDLWVFWDPPYICVRVAARPLKRPKKERHQCQATCTKHTKSADDVWVMRTTYIHTYREDMFHMYIYGIRCTVLVMAVGLHFLSLTTASSSSSSSSTRFRKLTTTDFDK